MKTKLQKQNEHLVNLQNNVPKFLPKQQQQQQQKHQNEKPSK